MKLEGRSVAKHTSKSGRVNLIVTDGGRICVPSSTVLTRPLFNPRHTRSTTRRFACAFTSM